MTELKITSPAFETEDWMPSCYSGFGEDFSPEIHIDDIDARTVSLVITLDDLGHPIRPGYNHWVAWNIPPVNVLPEHLPKGAVVEQPLHIEQGLAYGKHCYRGPKPPLNWNHRYCFTVYALDVLLKISTDSDKEAVLKVMDGHILQTGVLYGKYQKKHK
ncbi:MAG: YbhB/YbcL family Raf kinase inhibitor-like protein [Eubacteriales bacterium]|nr:YbhB/YbcL family Raf kinase inhibitor-like protein [Eubacteriales bacterium]